METLTLTELQLYQQHIKNIECKDCPHLRRHYFGQNANFYCQKRKNFGTRTGLLRIKASDIACPLHPGYQTISLNQDLQDYRIYRISDY